MHRLARVLTYVVLSTMATAGRTQELPTLVAPKVATAPKIDGDLCDPCWKQAARAGNFYLYNRLEPATVQTEALICYDDEALYVAFECQEPAMGKLVARARRDDFAVSHDDCVELFLSAGTDGRTYYHFIVSPLNAKQDQWNRVSPSKMDDTWDADWQTAARKDKSAWRVEMAIPWYNLAFDLGTGRWRINFCRGKRSPPLEFSSWASVKGNFHSPERFGILAVPEVDFASLKGLAVLDLTVPKYVVEAGTYSYFVKGLVKNEGPRPRRIVVEAEDRPFQGAGAKAKATLELAPSRTAPFALKLTMPHLGDRRVSVRLIDAESDKPVYMATRHPDSFPQLMKGFLNRNYYTVEKEVRAVVILNIPKGEARFTARLEIRPKGAKPIAAQVAVQEPARTVVTLPLAGVPLGTHPALLSILDAKGNTVAKEETQLRREKPAKPPIHEVKADRDRMIALVDGKPFFPVGLYGVPPDQMNLIKDAGFNCTIFWGGQGGAVRDLEKMTPEAARTALRRYLDAAHEAGLMVIEWPPNYAKDVLLYADPKFQEKMDEFLKNRLRQVVEAQRDHPALLAYYSLDEPGEGHRAVVAEESRVTRELDPYHPNYVLFCVAIQEWPECIDIAGLDWYPHFGQERVIKCLEGAQRAAQAARRMRVPTWHVPLCERASASGRPITAAEQRAQAYLAVIGGVNGIVWWVWPPRYLANWQELQKLAKELNVLSPALTTTVPEQGMVHEPRDLEDTVQASVRVVDGKVYVITCNASPIPAQVTLKVEGRFAGPAEVMFENRQVEVKESAVSDRFTGYGTHVYVLNGTWPSGGTITIGVTLEKQGEQAEETRAPVTLTQENLVTNSGFEGEGYWVFDSGEKEPRSVKGEVTDKARHEGKRCATIERPHETGTARWSGWTAKLEPRTRYLFGCYGRAEMAGGAEAGIYLQAPYPIGEYVHNVTTIKFRDRSPGWDRYIVSFNTRNEPLVVRPYLFMGGGRGTAWFDDLFLVPSSERAESRNLLQNSSFEKDALPFWPEHWWAWAILPGCVGGKDALWGPDDTVAYHGKRSLRMTQTEWNEDTLRRGRALDVDQERLRVEADQPYTLSAYLKAERPKTRVWLWIGWAQPKLVEVDTEWKRYAYTVTPKQATDDSFARLSMQSRGTLWIDAVQFEQGEQATPYVAGEE